MICSPIVFFRSYKITEWGLKRFKWLLFFFQFTNTEGMESEMLYQS